MNVIKTELPEVLIVEPKLFGDQRGFFLETYRFPRYVEHGIARPFVQDNMEPGRSYHLPGSVAALPQIDAAAAASELAAASEAYLARVGVEANAEPRKAGLLPAVRVKRNVDWNARTTIIIPTRNRAELLKRCIETITPAAYETNARILVVDNSSTEPDMVACEP